MTEGIICVIIIPDRSGSVSFSLRKRRASYEKINEMAEELIPDKDAQILVYCRSGRRSTIASQSLLELGYTDIKEFGGIIDWKYDITKAD